MTALLIGDVEQNSDHHVWCICSFSDTLFDLSRHDDTEVLFSPTRVFCYFSVPFLILTRWSKVFQLFVSILCQVLGYRISSYSSRQLILVVLRKAGIRTV